MVRLMLKPRRFHKEVQKVGLFSPSGDSGRGFPIRFQRGLQVIESECLGWVLPPGMTASDHAGAMSIQQRLDDIEFLLRNEDVGLMLAVTGGYLSNGLLENLNIEIFEQFPKPIVGFSDLTALQLALYTRLNYVTFYGPSLLGTFGEFPKPCRYVLESLWGLCASGPARYCYRPPDAFSADFLLWDHEDTAERVTTPEPGWKCIWPGEVEGRLIGGNLETLLALAGTPYLPDFAGALIFWEAAFSPLDKIERELTQLEQMGVLDVVCGMLVGKPYQLRDNGGWAFERLVSKFVSRHRFPTLLGMNFGHTSPIFTLPIGIRARLCTSPPALELLEEAVA
jgi:muramoyltetrapeptide carboxypeptidase